MFNKSFFTASVISLIASSAIAQQAPAAPPSWKQGMASEQAQSPLHPFAPHMTGRASADLPVNKLKAPAGFKVEVWAEGAPEGRSLALGDKGTVFASNRNLTNVYAIVDTCLLYTSPSPRD